MTIPATRIDDKIQATRFKAWAGLVISIEPGYCDINDGDIPQVDLSPVIDFDLSTRRVCEDVDVAWDMTSSYSPFDTLVGPPPGGGTTWHIDWGDGNTSSGNNIATASGNYGAAAGEWDLAGAASAVFDITITLTDDSDLQTIITVQIEVVDCTAFPFMGYAGLGGDGPYVATTWSSMAGTLSGEWLTVNDISVMALPGGVTEAWIATDGGLAVTRNNGQSWRIAVPGDPPNDWGDDPAPTIDDVRFIVVSHDSNQVFALAQWQNGAGNYRGAFLWSFDCGYSLTWYSLGGANVSAPGWVYPVRACIVEGTTEQMWWDSQCQGFPAFCPSSVVHSNCDNVVGAPNGRFVTIDTDWPNRDIFSTYFWHIFLDLGVYITLDNAVLDGGINIEAKTGDVEDSGFVPGEHGISWWLMHQTSPSDFTGGTLLNLVGGVYPAGCSNQTLTGAINQTAFRYISARLVSDVNPSTVMKEEFDSFRFYAATIAGDGEIRPISASMDWQGGTYLYMTLWEGGSLRLRVYDVTATLTDPIDVIELGAASKAEIDARTYWAMPYVPVIHATNVSNYIYVYGRMNAPAGLAGTKHLIMSDDHGVSWTDVGDSASWAANCIGGFIVEPSIALKQYVFLNTAQRLWVTLDGGSTWTNRAALPFDTEAVDIHPDYYAELIIGNLAAAANPIRYSMDDGLSWLTTSTGLPAAPAGPVNAISLLTEWVQ